MSLSPTTPNNNNRNPDSGNQPKDPALRPPTEAILHRIEEELGRLERGESHDTTRCIKLLQETTPAEHTRLADLVDAFMTRLSKTPLDTSIKPLLACGLYNSILFLEQVGIKERAESLYETLLPLAQRSGASLITAWVHIASGINAAEADNEGDASQHFSKALTLIEGSKHRFNPTTLSIYQYFASRDIRDESFKYNDSELNADLNRWCQRILKVIDHPSNKDPYTASSPYVLAALEFVAEAHLRLENLGETPRPESIQIFKRLSLHAASSTEPLSHPRLLLRLAGAHADKGAYDESLSNSQAALRALKGLPGEAAKELRTQVSDIVDKLTNFLSGNKDSSIGNED